ncbi:MAG: sulfide/dihydroorotate dehydrogenase-like FAD/NAD-binding protein [Bacteroidales bacterium]|nr:sulfide/dihydroorotate dehydrogenase-like FAD/NAD-binding protein [Bacteroidales bacterium]
MYEIISKNYLAPSIYMMEVSAPRLAASAKPGEFLVVKCSEIGERIPLTISDYNREKGTVTMVIQAIGASTMEICEMEEGDSFSDLLGPLGLPSDFVTIPDEDLAGKRYLFVAGGVGAAPVYPQAKYLHEKGAKVDVILGAKSAEMLIYEELLSSVSDRLYICTDDGSKGFKGMVTAEIQELYNAGERWDQAVAIGPMIMMKFVARTMQPMNIPLTVSLNTLMVDATGMCGCCRVTVAGKTRFACVEGPEFNAYEVDFDEAMRRQGIYKKQDTAAKEQHLAEHNCNIGRNNG